MHGNAIQVSHIMLGVVASPLCRLQWHSSSCAGLSNKQHLLAAARKLTASREMLLWMTPSEAPTALQASECSELLDPMRASCGILAQH